MSVTNIERIAQLMKQQIKVLLKHLSVYIQNDEQETSNQTPFTYFLYCMSIRSYGISIVYTIAHYELMTENQISPLSI